VTTVELPAPTIMPYLAALSECLCTQLSETGAGEPCWCGVVPGFLVSLEYCDNCAENPCGMGWVRAAGVFPYDTFPISTLDANCAKPLAWQIEVGAVRCMPIPADGEILKPEQMIEVALNQAADTEAMYRALMCCDAPQMTVERYQPIGPEGGCVGGFWIAYLGL